MLNSQIFQECLLQQPIGHCTSYAELLTVFSRQVWEIIVVYIHVGSCIDLCTFISASSEILCCVATGWDQYVDLTCQNLEVLAHFYWCDFVTYLSDSATIIYIMITGFCSCHGIGCWNFILILQYIFLYPSTFLQSCCYLSDSGPHRIIVYGNSCYLQIQPTKAFDKGIYWNRAR